jgi:hypothetical protein
MSLRFSIVAEGNTDQAVLQNVLLGFFGAQVETSNIHWVSPRYIEDKTFDEPNRGTWEKVFQYLRSRDYLDALQFPGYLVVQIDSDVSTHVNFGVPHQEPGTGRKLTPDELVIAVRERLRREVAAEDLLLVEHRILFAIGVHETQCWLAPLIAPAPRRTALTGCDHAVQSGISDKNLRRRFGAKEVSAYDAVSADLRKRKHLRSAAKQQRSFEMFLEELERVPSGSQ